MKSGLTRIKDWLKSIDIANVLLILGGSGLFYGIYGFDPRIAFMFVGVFLIAWAVLMELAKRGK